MQDFDQQAISDHMRDGIDPIGRLSNADQSSLPHALEVAFILAMRWLGRLYHSYVFQFRYT
jgi:hypothetical protein